MSPFPVPKPLQHIPNQQLLRRRKNLPSGPKKIKPYQQLTHIPHTPPKMCTHKRLIFSHCGHSSLHLRIGPPCPLFTSGYRCTATSHPRHTLRVERLCGPCARRAQRLSTAAEQVRERLRACEGVLGRWKQREMGNECENGGGEQRWVGEESIEAKLV